MMMPSSPTVVDDNVSVRLRIVASAQFDAPARWDAQLSLLRRCATYDGDGVWFRWIDGGLLSGPELRPLWEAVSEYGTHVSVDAVRQLAPPRPASE